MKSLLLVSALFCFTFSATEAAERANPNDSSTQAAKPRAYQIVQIRDISVQTAVRKTYKIVVPSDITRNELKATFKKAIDDITSDHPDIDVIGILAYDNPSHVGGVYTYGMAEWAPDGKVGNVTPKIARLNDRSSYQTSVDIKGKVENPDIERPSSRAFNIDTEYREQFYAPDAPYMQEVPPLLSGIEMGKWLDRQDKKIEDHKQKLHKRIRKRHKLSVQEVDSILAEVAIWMSQ